MMLVVHVDDNLAHAKDQATIGRFVAELEGKFEVKSIVETFSVEKASRTPAYSRVPVKVPVPGDNGGAHVDNNDDTAGYCVRGTRCGQVLETLGWRMTKMR